MIGAVVTFLLLAGGQGALVWFVGRRLAAHAQRDPRATAAWFEHVISPVFRGASAMPAQIAEMHHTPKGE